MKTKVVIFSLLFGAAMASAQTPTIHYTLGMSKPYTHLFEVQVTLGNLPSSEKHVDLVMPAWRGGRYVIFDFSGGVQEFSADDGQGNTLAWSKIDKETWRIERGRSSTITVKYRVYANEFRDRTRGLNDEHAFVDPTTVFMFAKQYEQQPVGLTVFPYSDWHITTGLESVAGTTNEFIAPTYLYFSDCPIEIGTQKDYTFDVDGKEHVLMVAGNVTLDTNRMISDLARLVEANRRFWGTLPYKRYVFMLEVYPNSGGGTEHINSTIMQRGPFGFGTPEGYRSFLGLISHEYFHTWNVKQLRPQGIAPYDYTKEDYVNELWVAEGTTSYYGPLMLVRLGYTTPDEFLATVASGVQADRMRPGNRIQSLTASSFDAWVKYWRDRENAYNAESDYYEKGSHVSFLLDLEIRRDSKNEHSLDDVMRTMFDRFPLKKGYTVDDFQRVSEEMAGQSLEQFFADYVHGTASIPWDRFLSYAGLELEPKDTTPKPWLGVMAKDRDNETRVYNVIAGSPAYDAGLNVDDQILALDGYRVRSSDLAGRIAGMSAGDTVKITVFRNDELREFKVPLRNQEIPSYVIVKSDSPTALQKAIYEGLFKTIL